MPLGRKVGLDPSDIVFDGDQLPSPPQKGDRAPPQFSAHVYCGQPAAWIKIPLSMEIGPGNVVLHVDPAPPEGAQPPKFWPMSVVAKRLDGSRCHLV